MTPPRRPPRTFPPSSRERQIFTLRLMTLSRGRGDVGDDVVVTILFSVVRLVRSAQSVCFRRSSAFRNSMRRRAAKAERTLRCVVGCVIARRSDESYTNGEIEGAHIHKYGAPRLFPSTHGYARFVFRLLTQADCSPLEHMRDGRQRHNDDTSRVYVDNQI